MKKRLFALVFAIFIILSLCACSFGDMIEGALSEVADALKTDISFDTEPDIISAGTEGAPETAAPDELQIAEDGVYDSKDEVALYIHVYGHLPSNYITKKEAQSLGWDGGSLEKYAPGKCIGGTDFGNYEGKLPAKSGRVYKECDICTMGKSKRGAKRIVYSNDGLIYYTDDHYETFTLLYGQEVLDREG